jgi:tetratricopeptide (TPR) repeat protein
MGAGNPRHRQRDWRCRPTDHGTHGRLRLLRLGGEYTKTVEHADKVLDLYNVEKHGHLADILNHDPKSIAGVFGSISIWILGYPGRALLVENEKDAHARLRGHPFDLGWAVVAGAHEFDRRWRFEDLLKRADECERLGRENSLPLLWGMLAPISRGQALLQGGKSAEAIVPLKAGIAAWEGTGGKNRLPTKKALLAEALALTGDLDNALHLIDEAIAQVERPGWEERFSYAEILRLKGWILSLKGDPEGAEQNFLTSLDWARRQQAKMWELRTSTSLARLWQSQGKGRETYELLAPVYNWFTEGFDTKDLLEAKSLLAELG